MRTRSTIQTFCSLLFVLAAATSASAQAMPQECREAMEIRSPQAQVDMFTRCMDTGRLNGNEKATAFKQRAIAYMHLGQHQRALDDVNQAIKLKPGDADGYYLRGFAYRALGQYQRAIEESNRAIGIEPEHAGAYATRAFANQALGNTRQAKADARRAKELDPKVKVPIL